MTDKNSCLRCGKCCTQFAVCITHRDIKRISIASGLPPISFVDLVPEPPEREREEPALLIDGKRQLLVLKRKPGEVCTFYSPEQGCVIHKSRPMLCRCYPFIYQKTGALGSVTTMKELKSRECPEKWFPENEGLAGYRRDFRKYMKDVEKYQKIAEEWNKKGGGTLAEFLEFAMNHHVRKVLFKP